MSQACERTVESWRIQLGHRALAWKNRKLEFHTWKEVIDSTMYPALHPSEESGASGNLKGMCHPRKDKINCHRGLALEGLPGVHGDVPS